MSQAQKDMLASMHVSQERGSIALSNRPKTAATTSYYDESRIKDKLKYLDNLEDSMNTDIDRILQQDITKKKKPTVKLTKQMVLENAMAEELGEVQTLMLRDKGIEYFDDVRGKDGFRLEDLFNIECLLASHNRIRDVFGVSQLTTLVELNLSFNELSDLT